MMFHVPGWSVSSSSLKTEKIEEKATVGSKSTEATAEEFAPDQTAKPSKKRKRGQARTSPNVTADNLATLWERHIEGKTASHAKATRTNRSKKDPTAKADRKNRKGQKGDGVQNDVGKKDIEEGNTIRTHETSNHKSDKQKLLKQNRLPASARPAQPQTIPPPASPNVTKLTPLQVSMREKLISARFRHLNQTLYTSPSTHSLSLFAQNPQMFTEYHEGFRKQVEVWPENPVDGYVQAVRERGQSRSEGQKGRSKKEKRASPRAPETEIQGHGKGNQDISPLPRTEGLCTIADLGCGDAKLAQALAHDQKKLQLSVLSYDLLSPNALVTESDIAHLPLPDGSVDVAIFCLALMGTNWFEFVEEAYRVLRWRGELWVAEIKSRFGRVQNRPTKVDHSVGNKKKAATKAKAGPSNDLKDEADLLLEADAADSVPQKQETDVAAFVEVLRKRGFVLKDNKRAIDLSNKMFVKMEFVKALTPIRGKGVPSSEDPNASQGERNRWSKPKFLERDTVTAGGDGEMDESKVLKPCVYKLR